MIGGWWWSTRFGAATHSGDVVATEVDGDDRFDIFTSHAGVVGSFTLFRRCRVGHACRFYLGDHTFVFTARWGVNGAIRGEYRKYEGVDVVDEGSFSMVPAGATATYTRAEVASMYGSTWLSWLRFKLLQWQGGINLRIVDSDASDDASDDDSDDSADDAADDAIPDDPGPNIEPDAYNSEPGELIEPE